MKRGMTFFDTTVNQSMKALQLQIIRSEWGGAFGKQPN
jgi:hypothetical protein